MALVPPYIASLRPYEPGRSIEEVQRAYGLSRVVKLASNENPLGPSPRAVDAIRAHIGGVNRYPSGGLQLRDGAVEFRGAALFGSRDARAGSARR